MKKALILSMFLLASMYLAFAIDISWNTDLSFGALLVPPSSGSVVVSAAFPHTRTPTHITLVPQQAGCAASFTITGTVSEQYTVTIPTSSITLTSGSNTMSVDTFTHSLSSLSGQLSGTSLTFYVGATLSVAANQPAGSYSGTFDVSITSP